LASAFSLSLSPPLRSPETLADLDPGPLLRAELRPYQKVGLRWLWWLLGLGGCLADDMGLGKTLQVIALLVLLKKEGSAANEPSLLVVPASLIANWRGELARFAPSLSVFVAHPSEVPPAELPSLTPEALSERDVVITTYGNLQAGRGPVIGFAVRALANGTPGFFERISRATSGV
jgi:SNF2 family DNA or RNA helicase